MLSSMAQLRMLIRVGLLVLLSFATQLAIADIERPSEEELSESVSRLSDSSFSKREAAMLFLWKHAATAEERLRKAATNGEDSEALIRVKRILEAYELGIFPDTPPDIVKGIYEFRDGSRVQKKQFIDRLVAQDEFESAHRLIGSVTDLALRNELIRMASGRVKAKIIDELLGGEFAKAKEVLEMAALEDHSMRDLAAFGWGSGLTETLLEEQAPDQDHPTRWKRRAWLQRAANQLGAAAELGKQHGDAAWIAEVGAADGNPLAFCEGQLMKPGLMPLQELRLHCAQARLRGDLDAVGKLLEKIEEWARQEPNTYNKRLAIEALILNDRVDRALALLPELAGQLPFDLHTYRGTYGRALESMGLDGQQKPPYSPWIEDMCEKIGEQDSEALNKALELASRVFGLGEKQEAGRLYELIFKALDGRKEEQKLLVSEAAKAGDRETVVKLLAILADQGIGMRELQLLLFENNVDLLQQWYGLLREVYLEKSLVECLVAAWTLLDVRNTDPKGTDEARNLLTKGYEALRKIGAKDSDGQLYFLYVTAYTHELYDLATKYLEEIINDQPNVPFIVQLAGLQGLQEDWAKAAANYEKAWNLSLDTAKAMVEAGGNVNLPFQIQSDYLYRAGMAWRKAGDAAKGDPMIKQARLICLGDINARHELALAMEQSGDNEMALEEWALIARLARLDESKGTWAFVHLAGPLSKTDPGRAADYQERVTVARDQLNASVRESSQFTFNIQLRARAHQWRAQAHIKDGDLAKAEDSLKTYARVTPGNASIGEELLPMLEEVGQVELAYEYFQKTRALALEACELFPKSAMAHNNLAWLDARSRRNLDEAMRHAQQAVNLLPDTAAYMDTMAEVHFAKGDREKALDWSARAVKLTPHDQELLGQRKRFESEPLPEKR